jgi:hypothetical protein
MITFNDYQDFLPDYTPVEMFQMGIFGNNYFKIDTDLPDEFKYGLSQIDYHSRTNPNINLNRYKTDCGTSLQTWIEGLLIHDDDPNGWVEWYIKFYYGRRHQDDKRQIARFNAFKHRHGGMLKKYPDSCKTKQNLLQWAIDYKKLL